MDELTGYSMDENQEMPTLNGTQVDKIDKVNKVAKVTKVNRQELCYHIILDCDFPQRNKLGDDDFKSKYTGHIKDTIKDNNDIPILYDLEDARNVARKLVTWIIKKGTTKNKKFPIFGALILGFKMDENVLVHHTRDDIARHGAKEYNIIYENFDDPNLNDKVIKTYYVHDKKKRGLVPPEVMKNATLVSASYGYQLATPLNIGLLLLNMSPNFSEDDISLLREILEKNGEVYRLHERPHRLEERRPYRLPTQLPQPRELRESKEVFKRSTSPVFDPNNPNKRVRRGQPILSSQPLQPPQPLQPLQPLQPPQPPQRKNLDYGLKGDLVMEDFTGGYIGKNYDDGENDDDDDNPSSILKNVKRDLNLNF